MDKGINTVIKETKNNIAKAINEGLNTGLPIAVIDLMVDNIMFEIKNNLNTALQQEQIKYQAQLEAEAQQVGWVDPEPVEEQ